MSGEANRQMIDTGLLEWRDHDSTSEITYSGFGPYMVERIGEGRFRAWLPDEAGVARLMVDQFADRKEARAFCQRDIDGRRAVALVGECAHYLLPNETPSQRIAREREDCERLLLLLADERGKSEEAPDLLLELI